MDYSSISFVDVCIMLHPYFLFPALVVAQNLLIFELAISKDHGRPGCDNHAISNLICAILTPIACYKLDSHVAL